MIHVLVEPSSSDLQAEIADLLRDRPEIRLLENSESAGEHSGGEGQPHPDVVIVADAGDPALDSEGWSVAGVPIILLTDHSPDGSDESGGQGAQPDWGGEGLPAGVRAVLPRNVTRAELTAAIEAVAAGLFVFHPADAGLLPALRAPEAGAGPSSSAGSSPGPDYKIVPQLNGQLVEPLTRREIEVLHLLASGLSNKEISSRLNISEHTAKFHVASIMSKLGAASRTEAVTLGIRHGLVML